VSIQNIKSANGLYLLLALNKIHGGTEADVDSGFAKVKELVPHVFAITASGVEVAPLIQQEITVVGTVSIDDASTLVLKGIPIKFVYPKEGVMAFKEIATVIKGRPRERQELAHKFIDLLLSKEEQAITAKYVGFGPFNRKVKLDPDVAATVVYGEENVQRLLIPNWKLINASRPAWTERWNKEIERR
jgi:putative spermidine/putrescine transport system substrate-binding protein